MPSRLPACCAKLLRLIWRCGPISGEWFSSLAGLNGTIILWIITLALICFVIQTTPAFPARCKKLVEKHNKWECEWKQQSAAGIFISSRSSYIMTYIFVLVSLPWQPVNAADLQSECTWSNCFLLLAAVGLWEGASRLWLALCVQIRHKQEVCAQSAPSADQEMLSYPEEVMGFFIIAETWKPHRLRTLCSRRGKQKCLELCRTIKKC